jgi:hypothetical protein
VLFCSLKQTFQNILEFISFFPWAQSDVVALWGKWGGGGFRPQSTYLVLLASHRHSILFLIQVSTSENEIEQTSWCSFNSSNVLPILMIKNRHFSQKKILMIKNRFTFESTITNMVISELVMSSSLHHLAIPSA